MKSWAARSFLRWLLVLAAFAIAGCSSLPHVERMPSQALPAMAESPIAKVAADIPAGRSGFWPMPVSAFALDARVAMIRSAVRSIDLQYYLIGDDATGTLVLQELRAAAMRGVRVRLLVDDLYTDRLDDLLRALQESPNAEVRLFNPFAWGRGSRAARYAQLVGSFERLNHRMHNKLFIADGAVAVVGGRNLADEYFARSTVANFIDMDVLGAGAIVPQLATLFDAYWNSPAAFTFASLSGGGANPPSPHEVRSPIEPQPVQATDPFGAPSLSNTLAQHTARRWVIADALAHADPPDKARPESGALVFGETVTAHFVNAVLQARHKAIIVSPYFIPGARGMERIRELRARGVEVTLVTNSLETSDEPLVNIGAMRYRDELLALHVKIYELSASGLEHDKQVRRVLGSSRGRLHAKMAVIDDETVLVGSMNADLRSAYANTEIGVGIRSPELARMIQSYFDIEHSPDVHEVRAAPGSLHGIERYRRDDAGRVVLESGSEGSWWDRLLLQFQSVFIPEELL
jgi:cardiolipin synthase C